MPELTKEVVYGILEGKGIDLDTLTPKVLSDSIKEGINIFTKYTDEVLMTIYSITSEGFDKLKQDCPGCVGEIRNPVYNIIEERFNENQKKK